MTKRTPHDSFITIHVCEDGYLLEYPDPLDSKKLDRMVVSSESDIKTIAKLLNTLLEFLGIDIVEPVEEDGQIKTDGENDLSKIGFKIKTKE